jgi:flagellar M-ring protein FliF
VRRISTAILVDQPFRWEGTGAKARKIVTPPSVETLKVVHDIVAGITGFAEQRGDQITVETLPFESTVEAEPPLPPSQTQKQAPGKFDLQRDLLGNPVAVGAAVVIVLLLASLVFVAMRKRPAMTAANTGAPAVASGEPGKESAQVAGGMDEKMMQQIAENEARQAKIESEALGRIKLPESSGKTDVLVKHIRESVMKDPANVTNVLRTWISESDLKRAK